MENLKKENIIPYLPYRVKAMIFGAICELEGIDLYQKDTVIAERTNYQFSEIKLLLKPLSDLTEDNADFLSGDAYLLVCESEEIDEFWILNNFSYNDIVKLLELHYDVFELIKKGLAIDKSTYLKK